MNICDSCKKKVDYMLNDWWVDYPDDVLHLELCNECYEKKSW